MSSTVFLDDDYMLMDDTVTAKLRTYNDAHVVLDEKAVAYAWKSRLSQREINGSAGLLSKSDVIWHLPVAECGRLIPREGDEVIYNRVKWTIIEVDDEVGGSVWRVVCNKGRKAAP